MADLKLNQVRIQLAPTRADHVLRQVDFDAFSDGLTGSIVVPYGFRKDNGIAISQTDVEIYTFTGNFQYGVVPLSGQIGKSAIRLSSPLTAGTLTMDVTIDGSKITPAAPEDSLSLVLGGTAGIAAPIKTVDIGLNTATSSGTSQPYMQQDTYTILISQGGAPGFGPGDAKLQVTSVRGDDVASVDLTAFATPILLTPRGVEINIADDGAVPGQVSAGDTWTIAVGSDRSKAYTFNDNDVTDYEVDAMEDFGIMLTSDGSWAPTTATIECELYIKTV
jgi:hypothetical protein